MSRALALLALATLAGCPAPPAEHPRQKARVRVDQVETSGYILLVEEQHHVREAVAAFLEAHGWPVVSVDEMDDKTAVALAARRPDGELCAAPLSGHALLDERMPDAQVADPMVECEPACKLTVRLRPAPRRDGSDDKALLFWEAPLPDAPSVDQIIAAAGHLQGKPVPADDVGHGGLALPPGDRVVVDDLLPLGPWDTASLGALPARLTADFAPCLTDVRRDRRPNRTQISIGVDGKLARCEPTLPQRMPTPGHDCQCAALGRIDFGPASGERRLAFDTHHVGPTVTVAPGQTISASLTNFSSEDEAVLLTDPGVSPASLARCLVRAGLPRPAELPVQWRISERGETLEAGADPTTPWLDDAGRACLLEALSRAAFPCTRSGQPTLVRARLGIETRSIARP